MWHWVFQISEETNYKEMTSSTPPWGCINTKARDLIGRFIGEEVHEERLRERERERHSKNNNDEGIIWNYGLLLTLISADDEHSET